MAKVPFFFRGQVSWSSWVSQPQASAWCPGSLKLTSFFALASLLKNWCTDLAPEPPAADLGRSPFMLGEQDAAVLSTLCVEFSLPNPLLLTLL